MKYRDKALKLSCKVYGDVGLDLRHKSVVECPITGAYCVLGIYQDNLYVVFRGTELKLNDIVIDLLFSKKIVPYMKTNKKIKVHKGFILAYSSIREVIHSVIREDLLDYDKIIVTGHSLGGALATLGALDIKYNFRAKDVYNYNYGCSRVGNKAFVESYNKYLVDRTFRFVNGSDVVTNLPYSFLGFKHASEVIQVGKKRSWYNYLWGYWGKDHSPEVYLKELS